MREDFEARFGAGYTTYGAVKIAVTAALLAVLQGRVSVREAHLDGMLEAMRMAPARRERSIAAFAGLGLLSAAVVLVVKRGNPVATLVGMLGSLTAGAYVPVSTFPAWLRAVARVNPMTYALEVWRGGVLFATPPNEFIGAFAVLAAVAVGIVPLAWWALGRAVRVACIDGTIGTY